MVSSSGVKQSTNTSMESTKHQTQTDFSALLLFFQYSLLYLSALPLSSAADVNVLCTHVKKTFWTNNVNANRTDEANDAPAARTGDNSFPSGRSASLSASVATGHFISCHLIRLVRLSVRTSLAAVPHRTASLTHGLLASGSNDPVTRDRRQVPKAKAPKSEAGATACTIL